MNEVLEQWNRADANAARDAMIACCGASRWASAMVESRPLASVADLRAAADRAWSTMHEADWLEAFASHPRIGERKNPAHVSPQSSAWSRQEQAGIEETQAAILEQLAEGNARYEVQFGFTYIVCATGKSAGEMLEILRGRLSRARETELREAAEQQRQILQIRLEKWLSQ